MLRLNMTLLLILILIPPLYAQQDAWYNEKPITDIRFKGLSSISENELFGLLRPYIGQLYTDERAWDIQTKLYALDYFELIIPDILEGPTGRNSLILEFTVQEKPLIVKIVFSGNKKIRRGELQDTILVQEGDLFNPGTLSIEEQSLIDLYLEKGFVDAEITMETEIDENKNQAKVTFNILEGTQTKISEINYVGNDKYVTDNTLRSLITTKAQSIFNKGLYIETTLQEDIKAIERHYGDLGLIDAKVINVDKQVVFDEKDSLNKMIITIFIEEGEVWKFGGITFTGNNIYSEGELNVLIDQKPGEIFNLSAFQVDYQRVRDLYAENGYIFTSITYTEERNEQIYEVSYQVQIVENDRAYIENIIVRGNDKTKSYLVRRAFPLEEGEVYSNAKIIQGTLNLYNLQYFNTVQPATYPGSQDGLMDLVIDVEEGNTTHIGVGLSFSGGGDFPVSGNLSWQENNFLGRGQILGGRLTVSPSSQQIALNFTEPRVLGNRWQGGIELLFRHRIRSFINQDRNLDGVPDPYNTWEEYSKADRIVPKDAKMSYDSYFISTGLNTGYTWPIKKARLGLSTGLNLAWELIEYDDKKYTPHNFLIRDNLNNWKYSDSIYLTLKWDTRDLQFDPTRGIVLSETITYAGILENISNQNYIKSTSRFNWNLLLFDIPVGKKDGQFKAVFSIDSVFSALFDKPWYNAIGDIAETNGFVIDGMFIGRGWPYSIGEYYRYLWDNTAQIKFPIVPKILSFDIFLDAVGAWQYDSGSKSALDNWSGNDWKFSLGGGLRFANPQFPIGIYLVKRFQWKDNVFTWFPDDPGNEWYEFMESGLDLVIAFDFDIY